MRTFFTKDNTACFSRRIHQTWSRANFSYSKRDEDRIAEEAEGHIKRRIWEMFRELEKVLAQVYYI